MRCKNCGWENPAGKSKCEKCNAPLTGSMIDMERPQPVSPERSETFNPRVTVNENVAFGEEPSDRAGAGICPGCGYPVRSGVCVCPSCGKALESEKAESVCPRCHTANSADAAFCSGCGSRLYGEKSGKDKPVCPSCGKPVATGAVFCSGCGAKLSGRNGDFGRKTVLPGRRSYCTLTPIAGEKERLNAGPLSFTGEEVILNRDNTEPDNDTITSKEQAVLIYENKKWYIQDRSDLKTTFVRAGERIELKPGDIVMLGDRRFEFDY